MPTLASQLRSQLERVVIEARDVAEAQVIDGQQRLTTLTILLSALVSKVDKKWARQLAVYIKEPGKEWEGIEQKPRLALRDQDRDFFHTYVQSDDGLNPELLQLNEGNLSDPQKNIKANAKLLLEPKTQQVHLTSGTLKTEQDVKDWLADAEKNLLAKIKEGPVVIS
ncbi:MAG: GmrSD restriction endonuclease domain-containing protein [bacterium]